MAGTWSEVTPMRAVCSAVLITLAGFSTGVAFDQDLSMRNELTPQPSLNQNGPAAPAVSPSQNGTLPAAKSHAAFIWPQGAERRRNPLWAVPIGSLTTTRDRPIFSSSRRLPVVPQQQQIVRNTELNRPPLTLVGTIAEEDAGIAVFRDESSKDIVWLHRGESHFGWTLSVVKPREATMLRGPDTVVLAIPSPPANIPGPPTNMTSPPAK